jgi:GSH-dependent disulfide-bond oxidoreductase
MTFQDPRFQFIDKHRVLSEVWRITIQNLWPLASPGFGSARKPETNRQVNVNCNDAARPLAVPPIKLEGLFMTDLSSFPITKRWPAKNPDIIQLYSLPTPNGVKVSIALEEMGLPYEAHLIDFATNDQMSDEFISLNPNNKIPAIIDPNWPDGKPLALWESGAILMYLAEKTGKLIPADAAGRYQTLQWVLFQIGGVGPMFGQLGFFHKFAGKDYEDKRPRDRYVGESKRLLGVLDKWLEGRDWVMGDQYTIADIAIFPWVRGLVGFYAAGDLVGYGDFKNVDRVLQKFVARPAVEKGLAIPARG